MQPQAIKDLPPGTSNTTKSRYWSEESDSTQSVWFKRQRKTPTPNAHEPAQVDPPSLPGITPTRQQFKRSYETAFEFKPKDSIAIKEEPQDEDESISPKAAKLSQHFAASKASKSSRPVKPFVAPKAASIAPGWTHTSQTPDLVEHSSREWSAIIATLAYVRDTAITEAVVAHVLRWARRYASSEHGDVYDTAFIQSIFADLDTHGIESGRRAVLTEMLTRPLQQQLESLRSSSESLRSCLASINTPQPSSPLSSSSRRAQ